LQPSKFHVRNGSMTGYSGSSATASGRRLMRESAA